MAKDNYISGSEMLMRILMREGVTHVFGYPGGSIMPVYDALYHHRDDITHILTRHEQGAIHAAEGYARVSGRPGVVFSTSGPGATNLVTGMADALADSTPLVVITGQVDTAHLGFDAFQETDVVGMTLPVTKWSYQIRRVEDVPWALARAFYIASSGRPGPVVLDFTHDAQCYMAEFEYEPCTHIRSYSPVPVPDSRRLDEAAGILAGAERPLIIAGHGVEISHAEERLAALAEKIDAPVAMTLLGLSTLPASHPLNVGMVGIHGSIAANVNTNRADVILAVGMRFDNRVVGDVAKYAPDARIIHVDIDETEFDKSIHADVCVHGDAREVLGELEARLEPATHGQWRDSFVPHMEAERRLIVDRELSPAPGEMHMGCAVRTVSEALGPDTVIVTDVGINQMMSARYSVLSKPNSIVTSGGLGTMGFGLPAAIGAKLAAPHRNVCLFVGDGGLQMTMQEFGTIMEHGLDIKIVLLNNNFLGNVRQLQAVGCGGRFSATPLANPDFGLVAAAYGLGYAEASDRQSLDSAVAGMQERGGAFLLNVRIDESDMVFPMTKGGDAIDKIYINLNDTYPL